MLTRELRSAGYDPRRTGDFGIVTTLPPPYNSFTISYITQTDTIAFQTDSDEDGEVDQSEAELIAYRFNGAARTLERFNVQSPDNPAGAWEPVTDQVDAVNFVYRDETGARTRTRADIRSIEVSLLIRSGNKDLKYIDTNTYRNKEGENICTNPPYPHCIAPDYKNYRRQLWTTTIQLRNLPPPS
jgi:hypothetical protein